jgi:integrase
MASPSDALPTTARSDVPVDSQRAVVQDALRLVVPAPSTAGASRLLSIVAGDIAAMDLREPSEARYHPTLWLAWATLERPDGGGLARSATELERLSEDDLLVGVVAFLTWIASDAEPDHPLVSEHRDFGCRSQPGALRRSTVTHFAHSYLKWRTSILRPSPWTVKDLVAMADLSAAPGKRERVELTIEVLGACLDVLGDENVVSITNPARRKAWHARERAALLVRVWGVLRAGEAIELRDVEATEYGLRIRLLQPKSKTTRWVRLPARGDRFCPVLALEAWLKAAHEAGFDLGGRLLPVVTRRRVAGKDVSDGRASERNYIRAVFDAAGMGDLLDHEALTLGLHNFRSVLPTRAADAGHDLPFLQALGAWKRGATPANSYMARRDGMAEAQAMADLEAA